MTDDITIKLNSPGGDVFEGVEILQLFKRSPLKSNGRSYWVAASAATFILSAADEAIMNVGLQL